MYRSLGTERTGDIEQAKISVRFYRCLMDISRFDFELDEIVDLIPRLSDLAQIIELEPRLHTSEESGQTHAPRTRETFRVSCQLTGSGQTVSRLADLAIETGVEAVLDFGRSVRFRHMHPVPIPPFAAQDHPSSPEGDQARVDEDQVQTAAEDVEAKVPEQYQRATDEEGQGPVAVDDPLADGDARHS